MTYTFQQAQTNLAQLLAEAEQGKEVVIERDELSPVQLIVVPKKAESQQDLNPRVAGQYAGQFVYSNDWWRPLETDEELREYGFDIMIDDGNPDDLLP